MVHVVNEPPACKPCRLSLTLKHILVECANLWDIRAKHFTVSSARGLFEIDDNHTIADFIKKTHFLSPSEICVT